MTVKKLTHLSLLALLIFYLANTPSDAAYVVRSAVNVLGDAAEGLSRFVTDVA
ncbi:hypothetical protein [Candidatus Protofrankia californiensis]|uniref:hypothetical protein n=1 Tax=Candidatus Protofrankia californiensis TaxID=1839754 RepID=UPI0013E9F912|nr:hypothetical protein [Candidatus Protofrankia californiensis]